MGFIDELKRIARPYEDEEDDAFEDYDAVGADRTAVQEKAAFRKEGASAYDVSSERSERRSNKVVNIHTTTQLQVVLVKPDRFENAAEIADHLREQRTVVRLRPGGQGEEGGAGHLHHHPL